MSLKRINYVIFTLLLASLLIMYLFIYSSHPGGWQLIYIPALALIILTAIILLYQQQLQELRLRSHPLTAGGEAQEAGSDKLPQIYIQALDDIPESVIILNYRRRVIYHNHSAEYLFGIDKNKIYTDRVAEKDSHFDSQQLEGIRMVFATGRQWQNHQTLYINGDSRTYLHRISPIVENSSIYGVFIYSQDITSLIQSQQEAETAAMAKNQFLANISHELRTPLIGILGAVELLERTSRDSFEQENIKIISECGEQLLEVIDRILDVSRVELGAAACQARECNLRNIFIQTISSVYPSLHEKGLGIDVFIDPDLPEYLLLDQAKLQQVLINILYNAVKFTHEGGIICRMEYSKNLTSSWIKISISDTGIGIASDQLTRLFSPFSQVDNSSSRQYQGTGLGLYLCKQLVEVMNGELWIESLVGQGSTVYIKLPAEDYLQRPAKKEPEPDRYDQVDQLLLGFKPINILVVDDNNLTRNIVSQILHKYGFQTGAAANGQEAQEMLRKAEYDMVLMDMQMPLMDGYEATRIIRTRQSSRALPIIAMTADTTPDAREKCLAYGCNAYIGKPFKAEDLIAEINRCINYGDAEKPDDKSAAGLIAELMPEFLDSLCESIQELDTAVKNNDIQEVKSISHDIKGSAGLYGFHEISRTAARIEQAAGQNEAQAINNSFSHLCQLYKKLGA